MEVPLLQKGTSCLPPSLHLTERNRTGTAWTEQSHLVQSKEGTGQKIGEKQQ